jgi:hypothetical protein
LRNETQNQTLKGKHKITIATLNWKPEQNLLKKLNELVQQQGQSPEDIITQAVTLYLKSQMQSSTPPEAQQLSIDRRRAFLKLPLEERRQILQKQAENLITHYQTDTEWQDLQVGDLIEP